MPKVDKRYGEEITISMNKDEDVLISVIVPVYNVKEYLERCIESIIRQTYRNLEIWLVDDGSTDGSGDICDRYSLIDNRINVIHKENGGLSDARNIALDQINGQYVTFVDSDDYIHREMILSLYELISNNDSDMSACDCASGTMDSFENEDIPGVIRGEVFQDRDKFEKLFIGKYRESICTTCAKLYKSTVYEKIRFPIGRIHEDEFVIHYVLGRCKRIILSDYMMYYHYAREGSITKSRYTLKSLDAVDAIEDRCKYFEETGDTELIFLAYRDYLRRIQFHYYSLRKYFPEENERINSLYHNYKRRYLTIRRHMTKKDEVRYGLFIWAPNLNRLLKVCVGARKI